MLSINDVSMAYGARLLFTDVSLNLNPKSRYGLVGANGAGKSTFLKIIAGDEEQSMGEITLVKKARVGFLKQDQFRFENVSIINTVIAGKKELWKAMCEKEEILSKGELDEESGYRIGELEHAIMDNDGYTAEYTASELLVGLGIKEELHYQPLSTLSGGYKLRVLLAQSLFDNPDILLLDEPTNHLDMDSIYWLEEYLREQFKGVLVFISHDVAFLNNVSTHILDIDYGEVRQYTGNYVSFETQKAEIMEQKLHEQSYTEKKLARMRVFIERFRASATRSKQAQSREKLAEKIELEMPDIQKSSRVSPSFLFKQKRLSGKTALKVDNISKSYGEKNVLNKVSFTVARGDKTIIIGPNGIGKSTLLKITLDKIKSDLGSYEWGIETHISYFAQDHHELLNESMSAYDWMQDQMPMHTVGAIRSSMGHVLFRQDEAFKNILSLSGGEGARLLLAKIMLEEANVLILDEPTNHLDIESKNALKKALIDYPGTLIMVTHDRDFATSIATRIIALTEKKVIDFKGSYDEYLDRFGKDYFKT
jgi:ATPase subunit of ABC transporter with duplicated ATPase domains